MSAQNRRRIYWTNIRVGHSGLFGEPYSDIPQPADRGILLRNILEKEVDDKYFLSENTVSNLMSHLQRNKEKGYGFGAVFHNGGGKMSAVKIGGSGVDDLVEVPICVAMRGRNPENPSSRKAGAETVQMLEPAEEGKTNCLTSVAKDNLILTNNHLQKNLTDVDSKANAFLATSHKGAWANGMSLVSSNFRIRRITPTECARLQTIHIFLLRSI